VVELKPAALLLAACMAALPVAAAEPAPLAPCVLPGVPHEALCGSLSRALDPARPQGPRIDLNFAVLPALARRKKPDPVFFLAGGPGQSAIALAGPVGAMLSRLGQRRDLVFVDQRGTGRSAPLNCDAPAVDAPLRDSLDPAMQRRRAEDCLDKLQALPHGDLRHYTTSIAMADLDAVRAALGADRINLVAASYGTRAALEYARLYPRHVRRMVLDGVVPPDMGLPLTAVPDAQAAFDALLAACRADSACQARHPTLALQWQLLRATLPRTVRITHPLTGLPESIDFSADMLESLVRAALYTPVTASALPAAIEAAAAGRFEPLVGLAAALGAPRGPMAIAQGQHFSVVCSEDLPAVPSGAATAAFAGLPSLYREVCARWPRAAIDPAFRQVPKAPAAVLLWSGGIDPATPPRHGERVARALGPLARHEVVPQAGHGLLALPCVRDTVFRFIDAADDAAALQGDTGCARDVPRPPAFVPPGHRGAP